MHNSDPHNVDDGLIRIRGARLHNLKAVDLNIPRNALVALTGVSGSGKSTLAFGTIYAEAQQRYLESIAPYARRLFQQLPAPQVDCIDGLPPAVALQQRYGVSSVRSSVGSLTTLSNRLRMLFSRAGTYPSSQPHLDAECFSANTTQGACPQCHGLGHLIEPTEASMVPDDTVSIRDRAVAAWPPAWHGQNLRDILVSLGYDIDRPWRDLPKNDRDWILFTDEQPVVRVYAGLSPEETSRALAAKAPGSYQGTFTSARRYVLQALATTQSERVRRRVSRYAVRTHCKTCLGKRLIPEALSVIFAGLDIAEMAALPLKRLSGLLLSYCEGDVEPLSQAAWSDHPERQAVAQKIARDLVSRIDVLTELGLGYLSLDRSIPTLSPGEHQRLRLTTQLSSELFGVVYVLDEPSAGLHPADTQALLEVLRQLKAAGNTVLLVEHDLDLIGNADWIVDVGPGAGEAGGSVLYSGPVAGLQIVRGSHTARHLFGTAVERRRPSRDPVDWLRLRDVTCNNLLSVDADIPLGVMTAVTGVSGAGKSSLVSRALVEILTARLGRSSAGDDNDETSDAGSKSSPVSGRIEGETALRRLVAIDQKPIGRTPRSNLATYTGLFDHVRRLFAGTAEARARGYKAGRFSFNLAEGRCETCEGAGSVMTELLFMPSVHTACPACRGSRYNPETLAIRYRNRSIADVLGMTVDEARVFFADEAAVKRPLDLLRDIGIGYLRLGQPATELSGGEAQRIKLATELQSPLRAGSLYVLDEPTAGLHQHDVQKFMVQLDRLVDAGNTVVIVEHDMKIAATSDWVIDLGPGGGDDGGRILCAGKPADIALEGQGPTALYLADALDRTASGKAGDLKDGDAQTGRMAARHRANHRVSVDH